MVADKWQYETAQDLEKSLSERLRSFPREPDMLVYGIRTLAAILCRGWLHLIHALKIIGIENLPQEGSFVMVANHASHLDALCLLAALPLRKLHRVFPAAGADYFFKTLPRSWFASVIVNALPFSRKVHIRQSMALCEHILNNTGNVLIIFPEGTRSTTGEIAQFKPGIGTLLAGRNIPVYPCFLQGTFEAWPKNKLLPRPGRVVLQIGVPKNYASMIPSKDSSLAIAQELQATIDEMRKNYI